MKKKYKYYLFIILIVFLIQLFLPISIYADSRPLLIVGDDEYFPPYSFIDDSGNPAGFNIELITAIAEVIGYDVEFRLDKWSKVREALENGEIDMIGGMSPSEEREEKYSFSIQHSVVVRDVFSRKGERVTKIEDLKGKMIVVQKSDIFAEYLKSFDPEFEFNIVEVPSARDALQGISEGTYDYAAIMTFPAYYTIEKFNIPNLQANNLSFPVVDYGIAVAKDNEELIMLFNAGLHLIKQTGRYQEIYDKWLTVYEDVSVFDYIKNFWWVFFIIGIIIAFLLVLSIVLRYLIRERTEELRKNYEDLRISEEKRSSILEALPDWVFSFSRQGIITNYHKESDSGLLLSKDEFIGKHISEILPENIAAKTLEKIKNVFDQGLLQTLYYDLGEEGSIQSYELRIVKSDEAEVLGFLREVTAEKRYRENIEYLSKHDALTGLYNRHYFEKKLLELDKEENYPLCLIMADVNGLKLINDSFGYKVGDQMLIKVGEVFKKVCNSGEYLFRIGGDEFVIMVTNKRASQAEELVSRIKNAAKEERIKPTRISVSFGWAVKRDNSQDIQEVLKESENQMHKRKLYEGPSIRSKTINTIIKTLYEKNKREEEHSRRVSTLTGEFAEVLGMNDQEVQEIKTTGLLHDIGKIAIAENILNKKGRLSQEEYEEIKRHPEVGYRILSSVNDMSDMANYVLAHHERWDGKGYPKGIKGEAIPLQSRMISIVDAYDAMISYRTYRKEKTKEEAIEELRSNSASQFDPNLVEIFVQIILNREQGD